MDSKGLDTGTSSLPGLTLKRRTRLLIFGINQYSDWNELRYPVSDCTQLWEVLKTEYGFEEEDLIYKPLNGVGGGLNTGDREATRKVIYGELYRLLEDEYGKPRIGSDENLIVVFSGHGYWDNVLKRGFWVPANAPKKIVPPDDLESLISDNQVIEVLARVKAHHILLIVDTCFSEAFANVAVDIPAENDSNNPEDIPSRWVLTAGRLEPVQDKSEFSRKLIEFLRENKNDKISISTLGARVVEAVREIKGTSPLCTSIVDPKYRKGEYFFHRQKAALVQTNDLPKIPIPEFANKLRQASGQKRELLIHGRYQYLTIENILLTGLKFSEEPEESPPASKQNLALLEAVERIWAAPKPHAVLFGEGGMGKTVSLLCLWDALLKDREAGPIPLFVPLNEYNSATEAEKDDFILKYIARHYLQNWELTSNVRNSLWELFTTISPEQPGVMLLLDGFNEITARKDQLLIDLDLIATNAPGVQMVIASRFTDIQNFPWARKAQTLELKPLSPQAIATYLRQVKLSLPTDPTLLKLFTNPMMLTLYAGTNTIVTNYTDDKRYQFKKVATYGELLWNFNEAQLAKQIEASQYNREEELYQTFLFRVLVPYLAFHMEQKGVYSITSRVSNNPDFNFKSLLENAFEELNTEELVELYPEFEGNRTLLGLGVLNTIDENEKRAGKVKKYLVEKLRLLVMEGDELRFQHQNFRDFFAASHIRSAIQMAMMRKKIPEALSFKLLPVYLRRMLGEIEGEHYIVPTWDAQAKQLILPIRENLLSRVLDSCRGVLSGTNSTNPQPTTFVVWNILSIWQEIRQTLAGANLTNLDLRKINFNGRPLTAHREAHYLAARFDGSLLDGDKFIFNGHYGQVNRACYDADGTYIVSASDDQKMIKWDSSTGELLQTYIQHTNKVSSVEFSPNRQKILSASYDLTLGERTLGTGTFRFINTGHGNRINHAVYSPDGQTILTASGDATMREFSVETGKSIHTYTDHEKSVQHISFHPVGDRFLSASADETIREWSFKSKTMLRTIKGHSARVTWVSYSPDGNKAVSASDDHTIRIWNMVMEEPPIVLFGHTNAVHSAVFSNDGQKILSASADGTVREWSAMSGALLKIYEGHFDKVNSAFYSPDERKILSASDDKSIREWSVETGILLKIIEGKSIWVGRGSGSFDPTGSRFLTVNYDKSLSEFSSLNGMCLQNLEGHTKWISGAWYSPDGKRILSSSDDKTLREWSVADGSCLNVFIGHTYGIKDAVYSANGTQIFSLSFRDEYKEWSAQTGNCLLTLTDALARTRFAERKKENSLPQKTDLIVKARKEIILVDKATGGNYLTLQNQTGLLVQGCDFRNIHPASTFSDTVKTHLRMYGGVFSDEDAVRWEAAVKDGYGE